MVDYQTNKKVKAIRTDNGLEFRNFEFDSFFKESEILRHRTAEKMNKTL